MSTTIIDEDGVHLTSFVGPEDGGKDRTRYALEISPSQSLTREELRNLVRKLVEEFRHDEFGCPWCGA